VTTVSERPVPSASKLWNGNGLRVADTREPDWQGGGVPDTSQAVSCPECGRRWLTAEWLAQHVEAAHTSKLPKQLRSARGGATRSAIEAISDRIADGTLKPGEPLHQKELAEHIGVSGGSVAAAVSQLAADGVLVYEGIAFRRRALVADVVPACITF
jgi:Bacterial regulatory proteins, gntR family